jgi:hypothetical protein
VGILLYEDNDTPITWSAHRHGLVALADVVCWMRLPDPIERADNGYDNDCGYDGDHNNSAYANMSAVQRI